MTETFTFLPTRTPGIVFHVFLILLILAGCGFLVWQAFLQQGGALLVVCLLGAIVLFASLPIVGYRGYALLQGIYSLKRDGLRVRWGMRAEDIPLSDVTWVRPASDLEIPLKLPSFSMPAPFSGSQSIRTWGKLIYCLGLSQPGYRGHAGQNLCLVSRAHGRVHSAFRTSA
jgi:hypothetical protein